jgi:hypothetical protein
LFSTYNSEANRQSPFIEIIKVTDFSTPMGKIIIAKSKSDIETQIIGPPNIYHQNLVINYYKKMGVDVIFIDGSLNRKSVLLIENCKGVIYLAGASYSSRISDIMDELEKEFHKSNLKIADESIRKEILSMQGKYGVILKHEDGFLYFDSIISSYKEMKETISKLSNIKYLYIKTSFTDKIYENIKYILKDRKFDIIFSNSFNIMLNKPNYFNLIGNFDIYLLNKVPILSLGVNSFSDKGDVIDCDELRENIINKFPDIPVIDIMAIS